MKERFQGNMAVRELISTGEVKDAIEIAIAPLKLLLELSCDRLERKDSSQERNLCFTLGRAIDDLESIGKVACNLDIERAERRAMHVKDLLKRAKPDITETELSAMLYEFLSGGDKQEAAHEDQENSDICESFN